MRRRSSVPQSRAFAAVVADDEISEVGSGGVAVKVGALAENVHGGAAGPGLDVHLEAVITVRGLGGVRVLLRKNGERQGDRVSRVVCGGDEEGARAAIWTRMGAGELSGVGICCARACYLDELLDGRAAEGTGRGLVLRPVLRIAWE